jgi:hypothetical protein
MLAHPDQCDYRKGRIPPLEKVDEKWDITRKRALNFAPRDRSPGQGGGDEHFRISYYSPQGVRLIAWRTGARLGALQDPDLEQPDDLGLPALAQSSGLVAGKRKLRLSLLEPHIRELLPSEGKLVFQRERLRRRHLACN